MPRDALTIGTTGAFPRLVRLIDFLCRGASPPAVIDLVHTRQSHLRRRLTMIARYDASPRRWSVPSVLLSLGIVAVALSGAVRGQEGGAKPQAAGEPVAAEPRAAAEEKPVRAATGPAMINVYPPGYANMTEDEAAKKLWDAKYAKEIFFVNGREVNREQVDRKYLAELQNLKQAMRSAQGAAGRTRAGEPARVEDEDVDRAVLAQLDRTIPELNFADTALSEVVDFLRDVSGTNLVVEWGALAAAGVDRNAPVSLRLKNVPFGQALDIVLSAAGGGTVPLGYTIDRSVIRVATTEYLDRFTDIRAYDVRDIVPAEMPMEGLQKLVLEAVAPDTWRDNGGSVGSIHASKHKLIVNQTAMNHREVRSVLKMLREEPRQAVATDAASAAQAPAPARH